MLTRASRPVDQESVTIPLLEGLDPDAAREIRQRLEPVSIAGDAILFEQGDRADSLYVLVSGAVGIATVDQATGVARRLARMQPPEIVGDVALLTNGVRSARATALRDSLLLRLDKDAFDEIAARHPGAMLYCARKLADRLRAGAGPQRYEQAPVTFAVAAVTEGVRASDFAHRLTAALGERALCLTTWPEGADETWFHTLETSRSHVIYATDAAASAWGQLCLRRADHVLLLAAPERPALPPLRQIGARAPDVWRRYDLVVVQPAGALTPRRIDPGLGTPAVAMRHHVRDGRAADLARLGRLICRRGQGLVLGGGGARGFAHIGVLRALREAGYAVDHVGGTSIGAVIAAGVASDWSVEEIHRHILEAFVESSPLDDYTPPVVSLTRGAKVDARLKSRFGEAVIEDLWLPFFCISTNLSSGTSKIHDRGHVAGALRASIAIPGLLPPVLSEEGVLVDGGTMNNLPADVMADLCRGSVLAVDVGSALAFERTRPRSWRGRLARRLLGLPDAMPGITQLLLRAATVSSDAQVELARARADVVLRPPLSGIDLRAWRAYAAAAEIGYRHAAERIEAGDLSSWAGRV